jgi:hypothetical protein
MLGGEALSCAPTLRTGKLLVVFSDFSWDPKGVSKVGAYPSGTSFQVLSSRLGSWPYPQTLNWTWKACQGQTLYLITKVRRLWTEKVFITLALVRFVQVMRVYRNKYIISSLNEQKVSRHFAKRHSAEWHSAEWHSNDRHLAELRSTESLIKIIFKWMTLIMTFSRMTLSRMSNSWTKLCWMTFCRLTFKWQAFSRIAFNGITRS